MTALRCNGLTGKALSSAPAHDGHAPSLVSAWFLFQLWAVVNQNLRDLRFALGFSIGLRFPMLRACWDSNNIMQMEAQVQREWRSRSMLLRILNQPPHSNPGVQQTITIAITSDFAIARCHCRDFQQESDIVQSLSTAAIAIATAARNRNLLLWAQP